MVWLVPVLGVAGGCGGGSDLPEVARCEVSEPTPGATAEIGTGEVSFEPLTDGQPLQIHTGMQGGFHFVAHARMTGMDPGDVNQPGEPINPETTFCAFREDDRTPVHLQPISYLIGYEPDGAGYALPSGRFLQLSSAVAPDLAGTRIVVSIAVRDPSGVHAYSERVVTASDAAPPL